MNEKIMNGEKGLISHTLKKKNLRFCISNRRGGPTCHLTILSTAIKFICGALIMVFKSFIASFFFLMISNNLTSFQLLLLIINIIHVYFNFIF